MIDKIQTDIRKAVSDQKSDAGHRAFYLGSETSLPPFTVAELKQLTENVTVSTEDQGYLDEIITTFDSTGALPFSWTPQEDHYYRHNGNARLLDYLIYRFKFRVLPERRALPSFPVHLLIEPTSACNLRCVMCFQTDKSFTNKSYMGMMDFGLYKDIVDQAVEGGAGALSLGSRGEPFMHRQIGEMLEYASGKGFFDLKINTNATRFTEEYCHTILSSDVNLIALSIDAGTKDLYEKIRVRGKFDSVVENVRMLKEVREKHYPNSNAEIRVSGVRFREDQDEEQFHGFWRDLVDTVVFVRAQLRWDTYNNPLHPERDSPCDFLWNRLYVWHDGKTNPCDEDYKSFLSPGAVQNRSIQDIWLGPEMTKLRNAHLKSNRSSFVPCDRCGV